MTEHLIPLHIPQDVIIAIYHTMFLGLSLIFNASSQRR